MNRLVITALFSLAAAALLVGRAVGAAAAEEPDRAWPVGDRPDVLRGWEPPPSPYAAGHRGVDLAAPAGAQVRAAAAGRVSFAGQVADRGVLSITLPASGEPPLRTTYEPVRALVAEGDEVVAGQVVAELEPGTYHCPAGTCLHWGLKRGTEYLDPLSLLPPGLLRREPPRLLPVFGVPEPGPDPMGEPQPPRPAALAPDAVHALTLSATAVLAHRARRRLTAPALDPLPRPQAQARTRPRATARAQARARAQDQRRTQARARPRGEGRTRPRAQARAQGRPRPRATGALLSPGRRAGPSRRPPR